jgi:hypothetical protein
MGSRDQLNHPKTGGYSRLSLVLAITALPKLTAVKQSDSSAQSTPKRQTLGLRRRMYHRGTGILTGFPFDHYG